MNDKLKYTDNNALLCRFVNDYKLPINTFNNFYEKLLLLEHNYAALTLYKILENIITDYFESDPNKFLEYYLAVRENVIQTVINSDAYKQFNVSDMNKYAIKKPIPSVSKTIYNESNVGKKFVSIDLTKANFQALKYADPEIMFNAKTYDEFISKFTENIYIKNSKYFRQVIFGQMNPARHITIERKIIFDIYDYIDAHNFHLGKLVAFTNDEIVFELSDDDYYNKSSDELIEKWIKDDLGFDTHVKTFELNCFKLDFLKNENEWKTVNTFFVKSMKWNKEYKGIPEQYFIIAYKLLNNIELTESDYHFKYDNMDCIFNTSFRVTEIY